jgi:hypothetical protein
LHESIIRSAVSCLLYVTFAKVGHILPMTGPFTTTSKQVEAGARFYAHSCRRQGEALRACGMMSL